MVEIKASVLFVAVRLAEFIIAISCFSLVFSAASAGLQSETRGLNMKYSQPPHLSCILLFPFFTPQSCRQGPSFFT